MTDKTIREIRACCDDYGDKLVALMDQYGVINLRQIPQREAEAFLNKLKGENTNE